MLTNFLFLFDTGLHQINRYLVCGLHPGRDAFQPTHIPWQALPGPAEPYPGGAGFAEPG